MPWPRSTRTSPGCVPGLELELDRRRRASRRRPSRRAPPGRSSGRPGRRCRCPRARSARPGGRAPRRRRRRRGRRARRRGPRRRGGSAGRRGSRPGSSTSSVRSSSVRPAPAHVSHGCSIVAPAAAGTRGSAAVRTNSPKTLRETCCSRPAPPQRGQVVTVVPGCGAVAAARRAGGGDLERDRRRSRPRAASTRSISTSAATSRAARRALGAAARPEQVVAEERGEEVAEVAEVEVGRLEAARAQPGVAVAVVELAASRGSRAPRRPRRPRGSGPRPPGCSETSGCSSRASARKAFLISARRRRAATPSSS